VAGDRRHLNDVKSTLELVRTADTPYTVYRPLAQAPDHWLNLSIRSTAPDAAVAAALRASVQQIDADQPVYAITSARESMEEITRASR